MGWTEKAVEYEEFTQKKNKNKKIPRGLPGSF